MGDIIIKDEAARELLDKASEITKTNYSDYSIESLICAIEDLIGELDCLKDEIKDMEQDIEDNYKPISRAEEINYSESDFI